MEGQPKFEVLNLQSSILELKSSLSVLVIFLLWFGVPRCFSINVCRIPAFSLRPSTVTIWALLTHFATHRLTWGVSALQYVHWQGKENKNTGRNDGFLLQRMDDDCWGPQKVSLGRFLQQRLRRSRKMHVAGTVTLWFPVVLTSESAEKIICCLNIFWNKNKTSFPSALQCLAFALIGQAKGIMASAPWWIGEAATQCECPTVRMDMLRRWQIIMF